MLPAYESFLHRGDVDPLVTLLRDAIPKLGSIIAGHSRPGFAKTVYEESIAILTRKSYYSSQAKELKEGDVTTDDDMRIFISGSVGPDLVQIFCIPRNLGVNPEQSMSRAALVEYLYSQSRWIEDYFTGSKQVTGPIPEIKLGEFCQFFSTEELESFDKELSRLDRPADEQILQDGFDNLRALVHKAATDPNLKLLYAYI